MLITVSGMVGSGKSTTAALIAEELVSAGLKPRRLRFRYLKLFGFDTKRSRGSNNREDVVMAARASGFSLRRLTAIRTAGYLARIAAFRLSGVGARSTCDVLDRYFYDNFVHYTLTSRRERLYGRVLSSLIPTPDLAVLVTAADQTIATRRPNYAGEYVAAAGQKYRELPEMFPCLRVVYTDPGGSSHDEIRRAVRALVVDRSDARKRQIDAGSDP